MLRRRRASGPDLLRAAHDRDEPVRAARLGLEVALQDLHGRAAERAVALSDLNDEGAQAEVMRRLRRLGVDRALARAGARDGDDVTVGAMTFTWDDQQ